MKTYKPTPTKKRPAPSMPKMPWDDDKKTKAQKKPRDEECPDIECPDDETGEE